MADNLKIINGSNAKTPCGLYRTTKEMPEAIPAGTLVFYHNHGNPGPGIYPVQDWAHNKAVFAKQGVTIPDEVWADSMKPLKAQGFYVVASPFHCCENKCMEFEQNTLVQLGYNGKGEPILFIPEWNLNGVSLPEKGNLVDEEKLEKLIPVKLNNNFDNSQE
ncbi:MAG: hypothetical protein PF689_02605 [Deltaproteobacteria bacterium]|jgi:hypothetical protein|nr:hypothetical protein [Deltaproteobacteria bacterium]